MDTEHVRVGFTGCGGWAGGHGSRMAAIAPVRIVGLCDVSDAALDRFAARVGGLDDVPRFQDHAEMLAAVAPDAVVVCSPHTLHADHIVAALEARAHVLCEKPMVCTLADAQRVREVERRTGRRVMVSYQLHLVGAYAYGKFVIETGQMGEIRYVTCRMSQDWIQLGDRTPRPWRLDPKLSGGGELVDSASHLLDAVLWLTGLELEQVCAYQDNCGFEVDVQTAAACRFTNGALGTIAVLGDARGPGLSVANDIDIYGAGGELLLRNGAVFRRDGWADLYPVPEEAFPATVSPDQAFIEFVTGQRQANPVPSECGLRMAELAETVYRSVKLGRPVRVSELDDQESPEGAR